VTARARRRSDGEFVGKRILCAGNAGSRNEIEKAGGAGSNFCEAFVRGSGRTKKDSVEMVSSENPAIVGRILRE